MSAHDFGNIAEYLPIAGAAAKLTRQQLKAWGAQHRNPVTQKGRDIKLQEDSESEKLIRKFLEDNSGFSVLGEEFGWNGAAESGLHWVVDPLDGSFNFFRGVPLYCVSIALCIGRKPLLGAIYDPERDELFAGGAGLGLHINDVVFTPAEPRKQIIATGFPSQSNVQHTLDRLQGYTAEWTKMRMLGTAALSLAWVAAGRMDAYAETGIMWWDVAAGIALAEAAGAHTIKVERLSEFGVDVLVAR